MTKNTLQRNALSLLLAALMLASCMTVLAEDAAPQSSFIVRVEGVNETYLYGSVSLSSPSDAPVSALAVLEHALAKEGVLYEVKEGYLSTIGSDTAGAFGGWDGWVYYINGQEATVAMADYAMKDGDSLLVCYADPYGEEPTLIPQVGVAQAPSDYIFYFYAQPTVYDAEGNSTRVNVAIADAAVTIGGVAYTTDAQGQVTIPQSALPGRSAAVQIEKTAENGKPLVVRLPADFTAELPIVLAFTDISPTAWYREYVLELVSLGAIEGYGDGTFRPTREVTRAEFIKILVFMAPEFDPGHVQYQPIFSDVKGGDWFAPYVIWAVEQGIVDRAASFNPNVNLTREDMALMAYRFATLVLGKTLPNSAAAPAFVDEATIAPNCREAVYFLQKAGVIEGVQSADGFAFEPTANTVRSQVSKVIVKLLAIE